jgi:hypothetical protein
MNTRRLLVATALGLLLCSPGLRPVQGAEADPELLEKYEKKIAKPFVAHGGWIVDYDAALAKAEAEKKMIFAYFTRSYAT